MSETTMTVLCGGMFLSALGWAVWRVETMLRGRWGEAIAAHARAADALSTKQARIDRALELLAVRVGGQQHSHDHISDVLKGDA